MWGGHERGGGHGCRACTDVGAEPRRRGVDPRAMMWQWSHGPSCTSTWTPSSRPSSSGIGRNCGVGRSWSVAVGRTSAVSSALPAMRPEPSASTPRCRCGRRVDSVRRLSSCRSTGRSTSRSAGTSWLRAHIRASSTPRASPTSVLARHPWPTQPERRSDLCASAASVPAHHPVRIRPLCQPRIRGQLPHPWPPHPCHPIYTPNVAWSNPYARSLDPKAGLPAHCQLQRVNTALVWAPSAVRTRSNRA
jgi:hypothetical protein